MATTTQYLHLKLLGVSQEDKARFFEDWRQDINGEGSGSNMQIIDTAYHQLLTDMQDSFGMVRSGTTAEWGMNPLFVPKPGEIIVYSDYMQVTESGQTYYVPGIKIGDGNAYLVDLPFANNAQVDEIRQTLEDHINNRNIHVSSEEKTRWNNKINYQLVGETLVLNRL